MIFSMIFALLFVVEMSMAAIHGMVDDVHPPGSGTGKLLVTDIDNNEPPIVVIDPVLGCIDVGHTVDMTSDPALGLEEGDYVEVKLSIDDVTKRAVATVIRIIANGKVINSGFRGLHTIGTVNGFPEVETYDNAFIRGLLIVRKGGVLILRDTTLRGAIIARAGSIVIIVGSSVVSRMYIGSVEVFYKSIDSIVNRTVISGGGDDGKVIKVKIDTQ